MNPEPSKLRQQQQQAEQAAESQLHQRAAGAHEFNSVEEMIRFDADQTNPPERIAERLKDSIATEPALVLSWWKRFFGKRG